jgi:hypothetical protein
VSLSENRGAEVKGFAVERSETLFAAQPRKAPVGRESLMGGGWSGGEGIRTLKSLRTPVFETGALPFCHPSEGLNVDNVRFAVEPSRGDSLLQTFRAGTGRVPADIVRFF